MDESAPAAPAARSGRFILPALGEVTTGFAELSQSGIRSRGISLKTRPRAQVVSTAAGMVAFAGPFREYGNIELGRALCRERVRQYVNISVVDVSLKKTNKTQPRTIMIH